MGLIKEWLTNPTIAYVVILLLTGIVYKVAFARKLPLLKQLIIYVALALGCVMLLFFHFMGLPIVPALAATVVLIVVARLRMGAGNQKESKQ